MWLFSDVKNYAGEFAYVAGWGRIGESLPISKDMLHVQLTVLSQEECKNASFGALITEGMICTYTENKDACQVQLQSSKLNPAIKIQPSPK